MCIIFWKTIIYECKWILNFRHLLPLWYSCFYSPDRVRLPELTWDLSYKMPILYSYPVKKNCYCPGFSIGISWIRSQSQLRYPASKWILQKLLWEFIWWTVSSHKPWIDILKCTLHLYQQKNFWNGLRKFRSNFKISLQPDSVAQLVELLTLNQ